MTDRVGAMGPGRLFVVFLLALGVAVACAPSSTGEAAGYRDVDVAVLHEALQRGEVGKDFVILDVRTPAEYAEGHIDGATLLPVQQLAARYAEVPRDRPVYVHCKAGTRSARAAKLLAAKGYTNVRNVLGGIIAWRRARYPLVQ